MPCGGVHDCNRDAAAGLRADQADGVDAMPASSSSPMQMIFTRGFAALCLAGAMVGAASAQSAQRPIGDDVVGPVLLKPEASRCTSCGSNPGINSGPKEMVDKAFLRKQIEGGMAEVQMGKLAAANAGNASLRDLGQHMATAHGALNAAFTQIAQSMLVTPPAKVNKKGEAEFKKLQGLSGDAFDAEYLNFLVKDHRTVQKDFDAELVSTENQGLKDVVSSGQHMVQQHLMVVQKLSADAGANTKASR